MTHITSLNSCKAMFSLRPLAMVLTGFVLLVLQTGIVQAQWTTVNTNDIKNTNTGNVGVNTTTPSERLDVNGTIKASGGLTITGAPAEHDYQNALYLGISGDTANIDALDSQVDFRNLVITGKTFHLKTWNGGALLTGLYQNTAGNVGINMTNPQASLDVNGSFLFRGNSSMASPGSVGPVLNGGYYSTGGYAFLQGYNYTTSAYIPLNLYGSKTIINPNGGSVGIGTDSPIYSLDVNGGANGFRAKASTSSANDTIATFESAGGIQAIVRANGNVGIGTTSPAKKLDVVGDISASGTITGGNIVAKYQDVAEWVQSSQQLAAGTVVVLDQTKSNQVIASSQAYDTRVAGVISLQPGITLGEKGESKVLVATSGRVKVKVVASGTPIRIGDLLVTSDRPGVAMRSEPIIIGGRKIHSPGTLIGKALEPLEKGTGEILVLLSLQ